MLRNHRISEITLTGTAKSTYQYFAHPTSLPSGGQSVSEVAHHSQCRSGDGWVGSSYSGLVRAVRDRVEDGGFSCSPSLPPPSRLLRLAVPSLASLQWGDPALAPALLTRTLLALRAVLRSSLAIAIVTGSQQRSAVNRTLGLRERVYSEEVKTYFLS